MDEFMSIFIPLSHEFPLSLSIRYLHTGIPRWRISMLGIGMAKIGGNNSNAELMNVEDPDWQQAIEEATRKLKKRAEDLRTKPFGGFSA